MKRSLVLKLTPEQAFEQSAFEKVIQKTLGLNAMSNTFLTIKRRSVDARSKNIKVNVAVDVFINENPPELLTYKTDFPNVANAKPVVVVGMGPAGIFAALRLIEKGIKPIIIERGKDVRLRRRDLAAINKDHVVNPDSNYCFGEGGAGTYSDGKLYTRAKKRGDVQRILEILVAHGASENILFEAHPHIGTNKLPKVVEALRNNILQAGGEILFNTRVTDFKLDNNVISGVITHEGHIIKGLGVILATGHSARDIFFLLQRKNIRIEPKPFAIGVRVEHSQSLIDQIQYKCKHRGPFLPASSYALSQQIANQGLAKRGAFSFCMCPGGFIVPAATAPGELVVNGMSPSRRDSKFANSGIVVSVSESDFSAYQQHGPLAGLHFQRSVERAAFEAGGNTQRAPAQLLADFVDNKFSNSLHETSYQPGLKSANMQEVLPPVLAQSLQFAFKAFGKKMKGYLTNEAQIIGVESRTSSPITIPRNALTCEHTQIKRLYPCGEGAGYAGGIVSAAMDGEKCADALIAAYY